MSNFNKNILMVVAPIGFQDIEYGEPREEFEKAGINVKVASLKPGIAKGAFGHEVKIDFTLEEVNAEDFDAVLFVGGGGMVELVDNKDLQNLAKVFDKANKLVCAICIAPVILANAGILDGKKATSHESGKEKILNTSSNVNYTGVTAEEDGNIITASGPAAARDFGRKIVERLSAI